VAGNVKRAQMVTTRKRKKAPEGSTRATGDILEEIVAEMHRVPNVLVERNAFLPVHHDTKRTREIDVLITSETVKQFQLVNEADQTLHKSHATARFSPPDGRLLLLQINNEDDLNNFEKRKGEIVITNRVRTPRIRWLAMYWPPSNRTLVKLNQRMLTAHQKGELLDLNSIPLEEIEGDNLSMLWEPIVKDHPLLRQIQKAKPNSSHV